MNNIKKLLILCFVGVLLIGCSLNSNEIVEDNSVQNKDGVTSDKGSNIEEKNDVKKKDERKTSDIESVDDLKRTDNFRNHALAHIFEGEINGRGQAVGFHYEGLPTAKGEVVEKSRTPKNKVGVYEAKVVVSNVNKQSNQGKSSFFPNDLDAQKVVDEINKAYELKEHVTGNTYEGLSDQGIVIRMYLDNNNKIISAFPVY